MALSNALERAGIPFRTLVPAGGTMEIYIIDLDRDLRQKILTAARRLRARVKYQTGNAALFGDDERQKAKVVFEQEIKNYEAKNPNLPPACDVKNRVAAVVPDCRSTTASPHFRSARRSAIGSPPNTFVSRIRDRPTNAY